MQGLGIRVIVFNATVNNISDILLQLVLLVEETGVHEENHQPVANKWQALSHSVDRVYLTLAEFAPPPPPPPQHTKC